MKTFIFHLFTIMLFLSSCSTNQEEAFLVKAQSLINEERYKDSFNLVELILFEKPQYSQAYVLYRTLYKKVGHQQIYKWEAELSRDRSSIYEKLKLVIPKINFIDKPLDEAIYELKIQSKKLDPKGEGINIISWLNEDDEIESPDEPGPFIELTHPTIPETQKKSYKLINIEADNIPIGEVIKYFCDQLNYIYILKPFGIIIQEKVTFPQAEVFFHTIPVGLLSIACLKIELESISDVGKKFNLEDIDWKEFLKNFDITFPPGSKVKYIEKARKMIFVNSEVNNEKLKVLIQTFKNK